jgi:hypothetical protein
MSLIFSVKSETKNSACAESTFYHNKPSKKVFISSHNPFKILEYNLMLLETKEFRKPIL